MKKTRFYGLFIIILAILGIAFTGCGQPNGMGAEVVSADTEQVGTETSMRNYLALLKAQDSHKVSVEGLQQIVSGLTSEFITDMPDSRTVSAGNFGNNVTGIRKLEVNNRNRFQNRNGTGGSRRLFTETETEPVEIYEFTFGTRGDGSKQYVLASTDLRIGNFLAITEGSLVDAEGEFAEYFKIALEEYIDSIIFKYNDITEAEVEVALAEMEAETETVLSRSSISGPYDGTSNWTHYATTTNVAIQKSPLLLTNWGQDAPYNGYIEQRYGTGVLAGCGAVAIAQIVAYHNYTNPNTASKNRMAPSFSNVAGIWTNSGNGKYNNLSLIRSMSSITSSSSSAARGQVAALMYHVMREGLEGYYAQEAIKNGAIYYTTTAPFYTLSETSDYAQIFKNLGYSVSFANYATGVSGSTTGSWSITYRNDSLTNIKNALNNNRPVEVAEKVHNTSLFILTT